MGQQALGCQPPPSCRPPSSECVSRTAHGCKNPSWSGDGGIETCGDGDPSPDSRDSQALINHTLLKASREGDVAKIKQAIGRKAFLESRRPFVVTPEATSKQAFDIIQNSRGSGLTALMYASQGGYGSAMETLVIANANVEAQDEDGMRPLHFAASSGCAEACRVLIKAGADPTAQDDEGRLPVALLPQENTLNVKDRSIWETLLSVDGSASGSMAGMMSS